MPRGLYGRAALILILPVVMMQLVISVSFIQRHYNGVTQQMTAAVQLELRHLLSEVNGAATLEEAVFVARQLGTPLELDVVLPAGDQPAADIRRLFDLSGRAVIQTLRPALPQIDAISFEDRRRVQLWAMTKHGIIKVSFSRARVSASNPHQLLVLIVVFGTFMVMIAYQFLRMQLRPIARMAAASTAYGKGRILPYRPSGATEVRVAGRAFLEMRDRIEAQSQNRTIMLSGVSHDLRTPLTRLRLALSLLDDEDAAPMLSDVDDLQHMADAFLEFARGEQVGEMVLTDPGAVLRSVLDDAQRSGQAAAMGQCEWPKGREIKLGSMALRRVLDNLIGNALRYGSMAEVSLLPQGSGFLLVVEDDGPGIAAERRQEALRPFSQLDPARNQDRGGGAGLGLAIVADIARAHGGTFELGQSARLGGLAARVSFLG